MVYVALLRGINVGGNNTFSMKKLKATFEYLGLKNVVSYINSGNVIFTDSGKPREIAQKIELGIKKEYGLDVKVLVRDSGSMQKILKSVPRTWKNDVEQKTDVLFLWEEFDKKSTLSMIENDPAVDTLKYIPGAIVWHIERCNYTKSRMKKFIGTTVYKNMTARNVNTLRKLAELMHKHPPGVAK